MQSHVSSVSPPSLRLFDASAAGCSSSQATLRECWQQHCLPELDDRRAATLAEYLATLNHWENLTTNVPVGQIDRAAIKAFRKALVETPFKRGTNSKRKRSAATVNKIMRTLHATIAPLWPRDRSNPGGAGLIEYFEWPEPLREQRELPFVFSRAEMSALYLACDASKRAGGYRRSHMYDPRLWRAAIVLALNCGPRTWDLFGLTWDEVRWDDYRYGSVRFEATKTAKMQRIPLNRVARVHLEHLRDLQLDTERVFPGFRKTKAFYLAWGRICAKAGVNTAFESFRKTCSTLHDDVTAGVGSWLLAHSARGVNDAHYQNPTKRVLKAVYALRLPAEFRRAAQAMTEARTAASA